jgi:quercetin dioxygenase-like cupin family protein
MGYGFLHQVEFMMLSVARNLPVTGFSSGRVWRSTMHRLAVVPQCLLCEPFRVSDFIFLPQFRACKSDAIRFDEVMFPYVALAKDKAWQPGPYEGVELMILHKNESTGGVVVLRKFKAGCAIPAHMHPDANEWAYVLSGEWEESDKTYTAGTLFFAPEGVRHGPHVAKTEVISLTIFDGPLTVA